MTLRIARPLILNNVVSPYGTTVISTLLFMVAWAFPGQLYASLMSEPDLMFLDARTLLFFLLCAGGFWTGLLLIDFVFPTPSLVESTPRRSDLGGYDLVPPLLIMTVITAIAGVKIIQDTPDFWTLLLTQQGQLIKNHYLEMKLGPVGWGANMQLPVLWWTYWRLINSTETSFQRSRNGKIASWIVFALGLVVQIGMSVIKVSRGDLLPVFTGLLVVHLVSKISRGDVKTGAVLRYLLVVPISGMCLFFVFGFLRGSSDVSVLMSAFLGYTASSYNRLAALLSGAMHYPFGGHGVYLITFLDANNLINSVFPIREILGWPDSQTLWISEFQAPVSAGLRYDLIWSGTFGYIFSDLGWMAPLFLIPYGMLYGMTWKQIKLGTIVGVMLYPWLANAGLCWFSLNGIFDNSFPFLVAAIFLLVIYEKMLSMKILHKLRAL